MIGASPLSAIRRGQLSLAAALRYAALESPPTPIADMIEFCGALLFAGRLRMNARSLARCTDVAKKLIEIYAGPFRLARRGFHAAISRRVASIDCRRRCRLSFAATLLL